MKILSQDKASITEPRNIWIDKNSMRIVGGDELDCCYTLGLYSERKTAEQVIAEIWEKYLSNCPYYEMP